MSTETPEPLMAQEETGSLKIPKWYGIEDP